MSSIPSAYVVPNKNSKPVTKAPQVTKAPVIAPNIEQNEKFLLAIKEKEEEAKLQPDKALSTRKAKGDPAKYIIIGIFVLLIIGFIPLFLYVIHP